jgi:hypothetical protein
VASTEATCDQSVPSEPERSLTESTRRATEAFDELTLETEHIAALGELLEEIFEVEFEPSFNMRRAGPGVAAIARDIGQRLKRINAHARRLAGDEVVGVFSPSDGSVRLASAQRHIRELRQMARRRPSAKTSAR